MSFDDLTPPDGTRIPPRPREQSILDALIIMAYNVGREHEKMGRDITEGRQIAHSALMAFVDSVDPGQLRQAFSPWVDGVSSKIVKQAMDLYGDPPVIIDDNPPVILDDGVIFPSRGRK